MKLGFGIAVALAAATFACYEAPPPSGAGAVEAKPKASGESARGVAPSKAVNALVQSNIPLDVPLEEALAVAEAADEKLGKDKDGKDQHVNVSAIMKAFSESLGIGCKDCHAQRTDKAGTPLYKDAEKKKPDLDYHAKTEMTAISVRMWDEWVAPLRSAEDGSKLFCDSCHQGKAQFLDRSDEESLGSWMKENFSGAALEREDGVEIKCGTCHGKPFKGSFLESWAGPSKATE